MPVNSRDQIVYGILLFLFLFLKIYSAFNLVNYLHIFRVDFNLAIKVWDLGFARETSYQASVKWMPPEMLNDGIFTEMTNVVGCKLNLQFVVCMQRVLLLA